ncbi:hypothetical protein D3C81_1769420 [compost metagenome]
MPVLGLLQNPINLSRHPHLRAMISLQHHMGMVELALASAKSLRKRLCRLGLRRNPGKLIGLHLFGQLLHQPGLLFPCKFSRYPQPRVMSL